MTRAARLGLGGRPADLPRRSRVCQRTLAAAAALLVVAGCSTSTGSAGTGTTGDTAGQSHVALDTASLRAAKAAAHIEGCPRTTTATAGSGSASAGLPAITLACLGGGPDVNLSHLRGPLVINLFAQWCGPCREEMPYYQELHRKAAGQVKVLGLDWEDPQPAKALALANQTGVTYALVADPSGETRVPFRIRGLPGVIFVDKHGNVTDQEFTVITSYGQLRTLVKEHLGVTL